MAKKGAWRPAESPPRPPRRQLISPSLPPLVALSSLCRVASLLADIQEEEAAEQQPQHPDGGLVTAEPLVGVGGDLVPVPEEEEGPLEQEEPLPREGEAALPGDHLAAGLPTAETRSPWKWPEGKARGKDEALARLSPWFPCSPFPKVPPADVEMGGNKELWARVHAWRQLDSQGALPLALSQFSELAPEGGRLSWGPQLGGTATLFMVPGTASMHAQGVRSKPESRGRGGICGHHTFRIVGRLLSLVSRVVPKKCTNKGLPMLLQGVRKFPKLLAITNWQVAGTAREMPALVCRFPPCLSVSLQDRDSFDTDPLSSCAASPSPSVQPEEPSGGRLGSLWNRLQEVKDAHGMCTLEALVPPDAFNRRSVAASFATLLRMHKRGMVQLEQFSAYGPVVVTVSEEEEQGTPPVERPHP
ncbi:hypothetical protein HPB48_018766 [Haemaphysalis longicornis]|uniref:Rad21/Rec8-like protein C-terminal eukaryotic domain-containing protein n=1 Tax=Haemaphysalis longicornis TaxID=44386 RepID=A0A9J6GJM4_HAELO|nr:hypothetical protein HPB48_018766 [Haemaphysalis longicornis]